MKGNKKLIAEIGIVYNGLKLISKSFNGYKSVLKDKMLKAGFFSAIQQFNRELYSQDLEVLGGRDFIIIFHMEDFGYLKSSEFTINRKKYVPKKDCFLGFAVIRNSKKRINRYIFKKVLPELKDTLMKFKHKYFSCDFNVMSQFKEFKEIIAAHFGGL